MLHGRSSATRNRSSGRACGLYMCKIHESWCSFESRGLLQFMVTVVLCDVVGSHIFATSRQVRENRWKTRISLPLGRALTFLYHRGHCVYRSKITFCGRRDISGYTSAIGIGQTHFLEICWSLSGCGARENFFVKSFDGKLSQGLPNWD